MSYQLISHPRFYLTDEEEGGCFTLVNPSTLRACSPALSALSGDTLMWGEGGASDVLG
jgi:hypothetical protein